MNRFCLAVLGMMVVPIAAASAEKYRLAPFKDELFKYPKIISSEHDGAYLVVDFSEMRDVNGRDAIPEKKAQAKYVDLAVNDSAQDLVLGSGPNAVKYFTLGSTTKPVKAIFIYVHGRNGNRFQAVNDWTFGGNFNRLKNLIVRNGGLYLSPGLTDMKSVGTNQVRELLRHYSALSPDAPVFLGCASNGGEICWRLASDPVTAKPIGGLLFVGGTVGFEFLNTTVAKSKRIPIYFGHGTADKIIPWQAPEKFIRSMQNLLPGYPVEFVLFQTGAHGTPIRMTDWRRVLNWMLEVDGK
jgi:hypothetical protein